MEEKNQFSQALGAIVELADKGELAHIVVVGGTTNGQVVSTGIVGESPALHVLGQLGIVEGELRELIRVRTLKQRELDAEIAKRQAEVQTPPKGKKK